MEPNATSRWQIPISPTETIHRISEIFNRACEKVEEVWAVYIRLSRVDPHSHQYSLEVQPDASENYARSKGAKQIKIYSDPDRTGRHSRRPGLQQLIRDIKAGRVHVVAVHRLDRLYRNLGSLLKFIHITRVYHVRLVSVTEHIDTDTWWGRLVLYVLGALAEIYVWQTSERTREVKLERMRRGLPNGTLPLGYCRGLCSACTDPNGAGYCPLYGGPDRSESQGGRIPVQHPIDQYAVRLIAVLYQHGRSYREVADYLRNHEFLLPDGSLVHFRTKGSPNDQGGDCKFERESVRSIIRNPFQSGMVARYPREPLDMEDDPEHPEKRSPKRLEIPRRRILEIQSGQHEPIYPFSLWQQNQALCRQKSRTPNASQRPRREYILTGVARCWTCYTWDGRSSTMRGSTGGSGVTYYRCATMLDRYSTRGKSEANTTEAVIAGGLVAKEVRGDAALFEGHTATLRSDKLEPQVDDLLGGFVIPVDWYDAILAYYLSDDGLSVFEREGHNLRQELDRQRVLFEKGFIDLATFETQATYIARRLDELKPSVKPEAAEAIPHLADFTSLWGKMTARERRGLLGVMFAGLYFDGRGQLRKIAAHSPFDRLLGLPEGGAMIQCNSYCPHPQLAPILPL